MGIECFDGAGRCGVEIAGGLVVVEVTEIRADDDESLLSTPQPLDHLVDLLRLRVSDGQRYEREVREQVLKKGKLYFEAVLIPVGGVEDLHLRQLQDGIDRFAIQWHAAQRCGEAVRTRSRQAAQRDPVRRTEQDHAANHLALTRDASVRRRGHRARIDVAGMGHDQRLRNPRGVRHGGHRGEVGRHGALELRPVLRIETARHGGRTRGTQLSDLSDRLRSSSGVSHEFDRFATRCILSGT